MNNDSKERLIRANILINKLEKSYEKQGYLVDNPTTEEQLEFKRCFEVTKDMIIFRAKNNWKDCLDELR